MLKINNQTSEVIVFDDIIESIAASSSREIEAAHEVKWANSSDVISAIVSNNVKIERNGIEYEDINEQINVLKNIISEVVIKQNKASDQPFADKTLADGSKIFKRKHGVSTSINASTSGTVELVIPYTQAKIDGAEIINCQFGDTADFKVYDNSAGTISGVPNLLLNQFGFNVQMPDKIYEDSCQYDADLIQGMKIEITYHNNSTTDITVGVNFSLHEVKS